MRPVTRPRTTCLMLFLALLFAAFGATEAAAEEAAPAVTPDATSSFAVSTVETTADPEPIAASVPTEDPDTVKTTIADAKATNNGKGCEQGYFVTTIQNERDTWLSGWTHFVFRLAGYSYSPDGLNVWANPDPEYASGVRWTRWVAFNKSGDVRLADMGKLQMKTQGWVGDKPSFSMNVYIHFDDLSQRVGWRIEQIDGNHWFTTNPGLLPPSGDPNMPYIGTLDDIVKVDPDARVGAAGFLVGTQYWSLQQSVSGRIKSVQLGCWEVRFTASTT